jgi:hypothetical protein
VGIDKCQRVSGCEERLAAPVDTERGTQHNKQPASLCVTSRCSLSGSSEMKQWASLCGAYYVGDVVNGSGRSLAVVARDVLCAWLCHARARRCPAWTQSGMRRLGQCSCRVLANPAVSRWQKTHPPGQTEASPRQKSEHGAANMFVFCEAVQLLADRCFVVPAAVIGRRHAPELTADRVLGLRHGVR